jgi:hypothetical protein
MLRVFGNRVLRRTFETKWDVVTVQWRKPYNDGFNYMYFSPDMFPLIKHGEE